MDNKTVEKQKNKNTSEYISDNGINVKVTYPDKVPEIIKRQKINRIYDILSNENNPKKVV